MAWKCICLKKAPFRTTQAVRKSPFPFGQPTQFQGKIIYRPCRTGVFPPTDWNPMDAVRSSYVRSWSHGAAFLS